MKTLKNRRRVRKTRRLSLRLAKPTLGGKYLYEGSFGCTFRPAIKCKGDADRAAGKISKLMEAYEAGQEFKIRDLIAPLDPVERYFIVPSRMCEPEITDNAENDYNSCKLGLHSPHIDARLLLLTDGGSDLLRTIVSRTELYEFLKGVVTLFEGLTLLHQNQIVHMDIKPSNLVQQKSDTGTYHIRYIDFGNSYTFSAFVPPREAYAYYPFDARLPNPYYTTIKPALLKKEIALYYTTLPYANFPIWIWQKDTGEPFYDEELVNELALGLKEKRYDVKLFIEGCDIFALGRSLYEVYSRNTRHFYTATNTVKIDGFETDYDKELRDAFSRPFYALIEKMISPIPFSRPSARMALKEYLEILENAKAFFTN